MDKRESKTLNTVEEIKIYSDPYRLRILKTFLDFGRPATVKEVADRMGEVPAKVYYHVKKLESIGLVSIDHTEIINGIVAKYYDSYSGQIEIKAAEIEPEMRSVYWSNVRRLIAEQFDQTKETFLNRVNGDGDTGRFMQNILYMNPEEAEELFRQVQKLFEPYERKRSGEEVKAYDLFLALGAEKSEADAEKDMPKEEKGEED
ncbi:ArsR/SmtB family transcription factor [Saccharibacillus sacchari]|uniref:ArsR/SmtB family transcription factor n=1 Tax=Saccharibacillus sacchari TaxID=456493 RepID=UPI0004B47859|nr:helix-turn-helix domain-containing protein [Saccharibacillus sacchari]